MKCPKCQSENYTKSGVVKGKQRYKCRDCNYYFSVEKLGKETDIKRVIKSLQLYLEGLTFREIERLIGVSHVSVMNWVKKYGIKRPDNAPYKPHYKILKHAELTEFMQDKPFLSQHGLLITPIGDKFMVIMWEKY